MENSIEQSKVKKIVNVVLNVLFYLFIVLLFVFAISNIRGKKNNIPNIFGYGYLTVNSNSMRGEAKDSFEKGDIIVVNIASQKEIDNIKIGDIVTFEDLQISKTFDDMGVSAAEQKSLTNLNTHRIVDIKETDGVKYFIAQGDYIKYPHTADPNDPYDFSYDYTSDIYSPDGTNERIQTFTAEKIKAIYVRKMSKGMSSFLTFLRSSLGFGLLIVLPAGLLLVFEVIVLIKNIMKLNKEKVQKELEEQKQAQAKDLEEEKKKMREEILAELRKEQEEANQSKE